jgi:HlyD family secretion protein
MKKNAMWIAGIALAALLAAFLLRKPAGGGDFVLKRTDIDYSILASCTVSYPQPYDLAAKAGGDVVAVPAREGQSAAKGSLLVQIDDFRERQNLAIAQSNYEGVKLKMANAREEVYPRLREQLNDAGASLAEAQANADRIGVLFQAGAVAKVDRERADTALEAARARFNQVKLQVDSYSRSGAAAELINQLNALSAQVELARRAVADKRVVAPYDCTVVDLDIVPGETVETGRRVAVVLERRPWILEANVDQRELGFLEDGLPAVAVFDAFPADKVAASVNLVCSLIDLDKGTCRLKLRVEQDRPFIRHGMTGSVEIRGRRVPGVSAGVLALPVRYIVRENDRRFVLLRKGRNVERTALEYTPIGEKWVAVRNLPEGARLALPE